jgi:adenylosuccinate synthase
MANAGHTAVNELGEAFVAKALPSASALVKWRPGYRPAIFVGASAAFHKDQLLKEAKETETEDLICVHPRAGVITDEHRQREAGETQDSTKHIASTMQGCGAYLADKVLRRATLKLARDYPELRGFVVRHPYDVAMMNSPFTPSQKQYKTLPGEPTNNKALELMDLLMASNTILHEGSQGFSLDMHHGSHYPQCTSRSTTAVQNLADLGLPPYVLGDTYLVIRPYPIRVGNVVEEGKTVGHSGGHYDDHEETTWEKVANACGAPPEVMAGELTTVTKRLRRVFTFSEQQIEEAVLSNGATKIALNFANYIDWNCFGTNDPGRLSGKIIDFIKRVEDIARIPVTVVGTGPRTDHVCFL